MKRFLILACAVATLAAGPALAQTLELSERGVLLDRVAVVVNDGVVLQSQVDGQVAMISERLTAQGAQLPPEQVLRQQILERLVLQEIQYQRAARLGIQVADEQLNAALRDVASRNNLPFDQMPAALAQQGVDYARYREDMRREITLQLLRQRDVLQRTYVSPRELEQYLAKQVGKADDNSEYDVSHILLSIPEAATAEQQAAVEQRARDLYERAQKGEDFGQLALTYSKAQTALDRGKLGWRKGAQLPQFIADLVAKLQPGQVAEPVRTPTGYHVVRLDDKRGIGSQMMVEQIHARHILMLPNEIQDDATTRQKLAAIRERILKGEDFAAVASVTSEDPGSATQGGDLGWTGPGSFVPEFEAVLKDLEDNEISEPFRTQFGWHIVQSLGRRTYDQGDDVRRQRSLAALREGKADEETELWLRRLRDEAYIEYVNP